MSDAIEIASRIAWSLEGCVLTDEAFREQNCLELQKLCKAVLSQYKEIKRLKEALKMAMPIIEGMQEYEGHWRADSALWLSKYQKLTEG